MSPHITMTSASRIMRLFLGRGDAYGTHGEPTRQPDSLKWEIKTTARTLRGPTTLEMWEDHLAGRKPLGIVPIREDDTCAWGSIDDDRYDVDQTALIKDVRAKQLPLVPCRSKSGGLHLFLFLQSPQPAVAVQSVLKDMAARLGLAKAEIFPKQTSTLAQRGDVGNWIVMPYFGDTYDGKIQEQIGLKVTGAHMDLEEFLDVAEAASLDQTAFEALTRRRSPQRRRGANGTSPPEVPFGDGPPCLQHLAGVGVDGGRNNALFQMGVYFRKMNPGRWQELLAEANENYMRPPLEREELLGLTRSLARRDYDYTCNVEPMCSFCDESLCRLRPHGVGHDQQFPVIQGLTKLESDPAVWFLEVAGKRFEAQTTQLLNYARMQEIFADQGSVLFAPMKHTDWTVMVQEAMKEVVPIQAPPDAGNRGRFYEVLEDLLVNRWRGEYKEDILRGKPWENVDEGRHYFRIQDLQRLLQREGMRDLTRGQIVERIRSYGGDAATLVLKGKHVRVWWVPTTAVVADPEISVPRVPGDVI